jgi:hypothetical protein
MEARCRSLDTTFNAPLQKEIGLDNRKIDRLTFPRWLSAVMLALALAAPAAAEHQIQVTDLARDIQ